MLSGSDRYKTDHSLSYQVFFTFFIIITILLTYWIVMFMLLFLYLLFKLYLLKLFSYPIYPINHNLSPFLSSLCLLYSTPQLKCLQHFFFFFYYSNKIYLVAHVQPPWTEAEFQLLTIRHGHSVRPLIMQIAHTKATYTYLFIFSRLLFVGLFTNFGLLNHHVNVLVFF